MHVNFHEIIVCNIQVAKNLNHSRANYLLTKGQGLDMNRYAGNLRR